MNFVENANFRIERAQMNEIACLAIYAQHNQHRQPNNTKGSAKVSNLTRSPKIST